MYGQHLNDNLRVGDIVLCQGSLWILRSLYKSYYVCQLVPLHGFSITRLFEDSECMVLDGLIFVLFQCPEFSNDNDYLSWMNICLHEMRTVHIRMPYEEATRML